MNKKNYEISALSLTSQTVCRLRAEILSGTYVVGQKLPSENALTQQFGVSRGTLRQALDVIEKERLIIRQQGRGTFVSNLVGTETTQGKASLLAIMVYEKEYFFGKIIQSASTQAAGRGYMLATGSNATVVEETQHTNAFIENKVAGAIITPRFHSPPDNYRRLIAAGIPVVMLNEEIEGVDEDFVSVDNARGTALATGHLIDLGHRRIAYVGHDRPEKINCQWQRLAGFTMTCKRAALDLPDQWVMNIPEDTYHQALPALFDDPARPTAIVTYNDISAGRVIQCAQRCHLRVPEDLSVVGFDDSELSHNSHPPITSVHPQYQQLGIAAVDLLLEKMRLTTPRPTCTIMVNPKLITRASTAAAPP